MLCAILYAASAGRILWYRPNGARHRPAVSLVACLLVGVLACRALDLLLMSSAPAVSELILTLLICAAIWAARGNIAQFFRG
ncbi:hypothetical protein A9974_08005 [Achromobacter sp. UMC71]|nr:hypothetical protein [Achromobacter sp. UMC71]